MAPHETPPAASQGPPPPTTLRWLIRFLGDPFVAILVAAGAICLSLGDRLSGLSIIATVSLGSLLSILRTQLATGQEVDLDQALPRYDMLMGRAILLVTLVVLLVHVACHRPLLQALLFSFALAFGMAPKAAPAIITISQALATQRKTAKASAWRHLLSHGSFGAHTVHPAGK